MKRLSVLFGVVAIATCIVPVTAQEQGAVYVTTGLALPIQQGPADGAYPVPTSPGGTTFGGAVGAGVFLSSLVSVEGEVSRTRLIESEESIQNLNFITSERRRENVISALVRVHVPGRRHVQVEPLAGLVVSIPQSSYQVTGSRGVEPKLDRDMPVLVGLAMGLDVRLGTERFSLVPSLRFRVTSGDSGDFDPTGFPRWTITPGIAARVGFNSGGAVPAGTPKSTYVIGGMGPFMSPDYTGPNAGGYLTAPSGRTAGMTVGGGIFLTSNVALDLEFSRGSVMKAREPYRYGNTFNLELRQNFLTSGVRFRFPAGRNVQVEPVAGFVLALHEGISQEECCNLLPGRVPVPGRRLRQALPVEPGITMGVDVPVGSRRLALLPMFRLFFTPRGGSRYYPGGSSRFTWAPGLGVRLGF